MKQEEAALREVSVGSCLFCDWKAEERNAKFTIVDGVIYVFCPKCGCENLNAQFLIREIKM